MVENIFKKSYLQANMHLVYIDEYIRFNDLFGIKFIFDNDALIREGNIGLVIMKLKKKREKY